MHLIKAIVPNRQGDVDLQHLLQARGSSRLGRGEAIASVVLQTLEPQLALRPAVAESVVRSIIGLVDGELRFVGGLTTPAAAVAAFYADETARSASFTGWLSQLLSRVLAAVPRDDGESGVLEIVVPLISVVRDPVGLVHNLVVEILERDFDGERLELGASLARAVVQRVCRISGLTLEEAQERPQRVKWPQQSNLLGEELVTAFLGGTIVGALLLSPVVLTLSDRVRLEHMVITAGSGHGKTQTLQDMIVRDLDRPQRERVGMVVLDSTGDLYRKLSRLEALGAVDRVLLVDASDYDYPLSLNLFNLGSGVDLNTMSGRDREQLLTSTGQLYEYVVGGLFGAEMTQKQSVVFRFLIRLMLSIPGATINTLADVLSEPMQFVHVMERMPPIARRFFLDEFTNDRQFGETRRQIMRRLYGILENQTFARMFASADNRLDLFGALNNGRVVLVNTSREFLGDACAVFGRYIIAATLKAAFDRSRMPANARRPAFLYIDEASEYFDENIARMLEQVRKYGLGLVLAHQDLEQMSDALRASVMSNTAIKLAGGGSAKDARYLAHELRTSPEFVLSQFKDDQSTRFATFVRNVTPAAVSWQIPFGTLEDMPQMSADEFAAVLERNRSEVSAGVVETPDEARTWSTGSPELSTDAWGEWAPVR